MKEPCTANTSSRLDYDPFGMLTVGRSWQAGSEYRFGFGGMENDDEVLGNDKTLDFGSRVYDARIGRWFSLDPLQHIYSSNSPYNFCFNSTLLFADPDGRDGVVTVISDPNNGGGKIIISSVFYVTGEKMNARKVEKLNKIASKYFVDGTHVDPSGNAWTVEFDVKYVYSSKPPIELSCDENIIMLTDEVARSHAKTGSVEVSTETSLCKDPRFEMKSSKFNITTGQLIMLGTSDYNYIGFKVFIHESFHLLGLIDRYYENKFISKIDGSQQNKPFQGYETSVMGGGSTLIQDHIDDYGKTFSVLADGEYHLNYFIDALEDLPDSGHGYVGSISETKTTYDKGGGVILMPVLNTAPISTPKPKRLSN